MSEARLVALLRLIEDGFNNDRLDSIDAIVHPDLVVHAPMPTGGGAEGWKQALAAVRQGFPDGRVEIDDWAEIGDRIYRRWSFSGTNTGAFMGMPPTGRAVSLSGVDIERFDEDKIVEHWSFWDRMLLLEQLGLAPSLGPGGGDA